MSNLACIALCILISFVTSACFISVYKNEIYVELDILRTRLKDAWTQIHILQDQVYVYNAKVYDFENKVNEITKEMEKLDDGK